MKTDPSYPSASAPSVRPLFSGFRFQAAVPYLLLTVCAAVFVLLSYVFINAGDLIHDYGFHLARIVGLAQSIEHGDWLPSLAYVFEGGIGYASPMFYGNWQLYLPALVYLACRNAPAAYAFFIFLLCASTACSAYWCAMRLQAGRIRAACFAAACVFSYSWFGYGMTMVLPFVPLLFYSMYRVLYEDRTGPILLGVLIALLIQTHILSTLILAMMSAVFVALNLRRLTWKKCGSFMLSALLGLLLSAGYLFQYFEQTASQTFFFQWTLRDYPFSLDQVARSTPILEILSSPSQWIPLACAGLLLIRWTSLSSFSKQLLLTAGLFFLAPTTLLPWESVLRYTFLAILQDPRRLSYFCALLVYLAAVQSWTDASMKWLAAALAAFYAVFCLAAYFPSSKTLAVLDMYNTRARLAVENPKEDSFGAIGDEYFTIGIVHKDKSDGVLSQFQNPDGVIISNVHRGYNLLEFDYTLPDDRGSAGLLLPEIFYKGYTAEYSDGGSGSQPQMLARPFSNEEQEQNRRRHKPEMVMRIDYNGQICLLLNTSGHVRLTYRKTEIQIIGYGLEAAAWAVLGSLPAGRRLKDRVSGQSRSLKGKRPDSLWAAQKPSRQDSGISDRETEDSDGRISIRGITVKKEDGSPDMKAVGEPAGFCFQTKPQKKESSPLQDPAVKAPSDAQKQDGGDAKPADCPIPSAKERSDALRESLPESDREREEMNRK